MFYQVIAFRSTIVETLTRETSRYRIVEHRTDGVLIIISFFFENYFIIQAPGCNFDTEIEYFLYKTVCSKLRTAMTCNDYMIHFSLYFHETLRSKIRCFIESRKFKQYFTYRGKDCHLTFIFRKR